MDGQRFDRLTRALATGTSRRSALKGLLGLGAAASAGSLAPEADARTLRTRNTVPPASDPVCPEHHQLCNGACCPNGRCFDGLCCDAGASACGGQCCPNGQCNSSGGCCTGGLAACGSTCCAPGACARSGNADICCQGAVCGLDCCASPDQCCDGECCASGSICIGEERCCPASLYCGGVCCNGTGQQCCGDVCLQAGQCCTSDQCLDSPETCQVGICNAGYSCGLSEPCASAPGTTCCSGSCVMLGTTENCLECGDACSAGQECCGGGCTTIGTVTDCLSCSDTCSAGQACCESGCETLGTIDRCLTCDDSCGAGQACCSTGCETLGTLSDCLACGDACDPGEICAGTGCVTTTTTEAPATSTTLDPATTTTDGPGTTTTVPPVTSTTQSPTTTTRDPGCETIEDCLSGEVCCGQVCRSGLCCDEDDCLELFSAACMGERIDGGSVNLCVCSQENACRFATCRAEAEGCESDAQCCDGLACQGTLPGNAFCVPTCPEGCPNGQICCNGVCQECCGTDTSNCQENKCGGNTCLNGRCYPGVVLCEDPNVRSCFDRSCNPETGGCEDGNYRGDGAACGVPLSGQICCNEECIDGDELNCGGCGVACATGFTCFLGQCQCDGDASCPAGHHCCNSSCLPTDADTRNCGGCGIQCPAGLSCQDGECRCVEHGDCPGDFNNLCRAGVCDNDGQCQLTDTLCATTNPCLISLGCNPATGQCEFGPKCTGGLSCIAGACLECDCVIDGACYQHGDERPNNKCDHCDANLSTTAWSPKTYCPVSNIDCIVRFCDPSDGVCYERVADPGATCLTPIHYDDWQCANLNSETGICKGQRCYFPDVSTFCNADPFDFCQTGFGICQDGKCKATPQNENGACAFGNCNSGTCQSGECVTFPINEGQNCSIGNPGPCHESQGLCSGGNCITFPLPDGTICNSPPGACSGHICQQGNCLTPTVPIRTGELCGRGLTECLEGFVCTASGSCQSRTPEDSFCDSTLSYCEQNVTTPGSCNGDGTCTYARFESGAIVCDSFNDPDNIYPRECCPGMVCSEPPQCGGFCVFSYCYYPEDLPGGGIFP